MISNTARKFCFSILYITTIILVLSNKPILIIHYSIDANKFKVGNWFDSNKHFITGVIKVQQCKEDELTVKEQKLLEPWLLILSPIMITWLCQSLTLNLQCRIVMTKRENHSICPQNLLMIQPSRNV
jgi:hypothetical protein